MQSVSVTKARNNIYKLLNEVNENSTPVTITNARGKNAVIISEDDWNAIEETLYLNSIPGMTDSLIAGKNSSLDSCINEDEVNW